MRFKTECYGVGFFFFLRDLKIDNGEEELEGKILSPVEEEQMHKAGHRAMRMADSQ